MNEIVKIGVFGGSWSYWNGETYLYDCLHHRFFSAQLDWSLLLFLRKWLIYFVSVEVKIEKFRVSFLSGVKFVSSIFVLLEGDVLLWSDSISTVDHHLCQDLIHQSLLGLSWMCHHKILNTFLMRWLLHLMSDYLFFSVECSNECETWLQLSLVL